jgi:hypothetical protein
MDTKKFKERLQWLGRMPTHWRILLGSQLLFLTFAISYRRRIVNARYMELSTDTAQSNEAQ